MSSLCRDELKSHPFEPKVYDYSHLDGCDDLCLDGCDDLCLDRCDDLCLDGREPSSEVNDLTLALSHLSTSTNSGPNRPIDLPTALLTPSTMNGGASLLGYPLTVRTVPATIATVSHGRKRYYVILVGKCAGIYHDMW